MSSTRCSGTLSRRALFKDYWGCIEWLASAGVVNVCHCLLDPELPLKGNYDQAKYKLYFRDSGLLVSMLDDESSDDLRSNRNLDAYKGGLYENIVAEALVKFLCIPAQEVLGAKASGMTKWSGHFVVFPGLQTDRWYVYWSPGDWRAYGT